MTREEECDPLLEIRIGLIGHDASVSKTAILCALLKGNDRVAPATDGSVNCFRVSVQQKSGTEGGQAEESSGTSQGHGHDGSTAGGGGSLQVKIVDVEIDEPIVEMKEGVKLMFVDIPGIVSSAAPHCRGFEEGGDESQRRRAKDFVSEHWHSLDCVIVVWDDGRQPTSKTDQQQMEFLDMAKKLCEHVKRIPLVIVMNSTEPDELEQKVIVAKTREFIEESVFGRGGLSTVENITSLSVSPPPAEKIQELSPFFIPLSVNQAYIHWASEGATSFQLFKERILLLGDGMSAAVAHKFGREYYGNQWGRFASEEEKLQKVFEAATQKNDVGASGGSNGEEEVATFIDALLKALDFFVGGAETQGYLINKQLEVLAARLVPECDFVAGLWELYDKCQLPKPKNFVIQRFYELHKQSLTQAFQQFMGPCSVRHLARPMMALLAFCELAKHMDTFESEKPRIFELGKQIVLRQIELLLLVSASTPEATNCDDLTTTEQAVVNKWKQQNSGMSKYDWVLIFGAILGMTRDVFFEQHFGLARVLLEIKFQEFSSAAAAPNNACPYCGQAFSQHTTISRVFGSQMQLCSHCRIVFVDTAQDAECCKICATNRIVRERGYGGGPAHISPFRGQPRNEAFDGNGGCYCSNCGLHYQKKPSSLPFQHRLIDGMLCPANPTAFKQFVHFEVASSPEDPNHFGHVIWLFRNLFTALAQGVSSQ